MAASGGRRNTGHAVLLLRAAWLEVAMNTYQNLSRGWMSACTLTLNHQLSTAGVSVPNSMAFDDLKIAGAFAGVGSGGRGNNICD